MDVPSVFTLLKVGFGPSSSHTMGPFLAARDFRARVAAGGIPGGRVRVVLLGSLALTGRGHLTDAAVTAGLAGHDPDRDAAPPLPDVLAQVRKAGEVVIAGQRLRFNPDDDILFDASVPDLPHPNTLRFELIGTDGQVAFGEEYRSLGGGVVAGGTFGEDPAWGKGRFTMTEVLSLCREQGMDLVGFVRENEKRHGLTDEEIDRRLGVLWTAMTEAIERGLRTGGVLPGPLRLARRAPGMAAELRRHEGNAVLGREMALASVYAIAVAEENAAGGRVVTAPTCGSAGVVPGALRVVQEKLGLPDARVHDALLVAGLVGLAVATNASISGAEVGCQGEVGTASAMAGAAVCHLLGGSIETQVDRAAETALEHYLGLTCDPVYGLVQIPCIERNAAAAVAALNAANLALLCQGEDRITFDTAVAALREIGRDMDRKYKETALGGIASLF